MRRKIFVYAAIFACLLLASCLHQDKEFLFRAPLYGLLTTKPPTQKLTPGKYVEVKWCPDQKDFSKPDKDKRKEEDEESSDKEPETDEDGDVENSKAKKPVVLRSLDQVAHKAHQQHKCDYFLDASFYLQNDCVLLRGFVAK